MIHVRSAPVNPEDFPYLVEAEADPKFTCSQALAFRFGYNAAHFLRNLLYWRRYSSDGWVYRTRDEIFRDTALTRREQETARRDLIAAGMLREELRGMPAQLHFEVVVEAVEQCLRAFYHDRREADGRVAAAPKTAWREGKPVGRKAPDKPGGNRPASGAESAQPVGRKAPSINKEDTGTTRPEEMPVTAALNDDPVAPVADQPFALLEAMLGVLGKEHTALPRSAIGRQLAVAKRLRDDGVTAAEVAEITRWVRAQWKVEGIDLPLIEKALPKWRLRVEREDPRGWRKPGELVTF